MNRTRFRLLACAAVAALILSACGNRGPLVLPQEAPPPMADPAGTVPAEQAGAPRG